MKLRQKYKAIGVMSGSSTDGLDLVCCEFVHQKRKWDVEIICAEIKKYTPSWKKKLIEAHQLSGVDLIKLDYAFGRFIGQACYTFLKTNNLGGIDLIASHGHTVFHQPYKGFTYQIGNGHAIHAATSVPVIYDFRSLDVCRGGQGAPLVSMGDSLLFNEYPVCLNLGGIANLSVRSGRGRVSYDICFANMGLDYLARQVNKSYDKSGSIAMSGNVITSLLATLNSTCRVTKRALGRERFEQDIRPVLDSTAFSVADKLCTFCEHIATKISQHIPIQTKAVKILVTGGGAFNDFLIQKIRMQVSPRAIIIVPSDTIVSFKEAIIFALLGLLRSRGEINIFRKATGSRQNTSAGSMVGTPCP